MTARTSGLVEAGLVDEAVRLRMATLARWERETTGGVLAVVEDAIECEAEDVEPPKPKRGFTPGRGD